MKNIPKLGQAGQLKNVSDGYARNFLIPKGFVSPATPSNIREAEILSSKQAKERDKVKFSADKASDQLAGIELTIKAKANPKGKLFAGIDSKTIIDAIKEKIGLEISEKLILLDKPIKEAGKHDVRIASSKKQTLSVIIEPVNEK